MGCCPDSLTELLTILPAFSVFACTSYVSSPVRLYHVKLPRCDHFVLPKTPPFHTFHSNGLKVLGFGAQFSHLCISHSALDIRGDQ